MRSIYSKIVELEKSGKQAALCTIYKTNGPTPRKVGAKMLVMEDGNIVGSIGGGALEFQVIQNALETIKKQLPETYEHQLNHDHGMCCGGNVEILIEPIMTKKKLYIFGAGHVGKALAHLADELDFKVTLIDDRDGVFDDISNEDIVNIQKHYKNAFKDLGFDEQTFVCVMTFDHAFDRDIIAFCAKQPHAYLGMIGSKRKVGVAKRTFLTGDILTEAEMENIDWPMGVPIEVETPQEIAVSILAKLIDVRSKIGKSTNVAVAKTRSIAG